VESVVVIQSLFLIHAKDVTGSIPICSGLTTTRTFYVKYCSGPLLGNSVIVGTDHVEPPVVEDFVGNLRHYFEGQNSVSDFEALSQGGTERL
jgi:hypothetical protein